jgi:hypothetical protein
MNAEECGARDLMWSQFMLVPPTEGTADASWAGKIWGTCQPCSGLTPAAFKRNARFKGLAHNRETKLAFKHTLSVTLPGPRGTGEGDRKRVGESLRE